MVINVTLQSPLSSLPSRFTDYTVQATTDSPSTASSRFRLPDPKSRSQGCYCIGIQNATEVLTALDKTAQRDNPG
jgi:hypothetical protein